jgi:hypothetical protein
MHSSAPGHMATALPTKERLGFLNISARQSPFILVILIEV